MYRDTRFRECKNPLHLQGVGRRGQNKKCSLRKTTAFSDIFTVSRIKLKVRLFLFQRGSAMAGVRSNDDSDNNFSDDESTPLYGGR